MVEEDAAAAACVIPAMPSMRMQCSVLFCTYSISKSFDLAFFFLLVLPPAQRSMT
jgi:hypothetical protein